MNKIETIKGPYPAERVPVLEDVRTAFNSIRKTPGAGLVPGVEWVRGRHPESMELRIHWDLIKDTIDKRKALQWFDHRPYNVHPRLIKLVGTCCTCGKNCLESFDGANDPRGPLGDNANEGIGPESVDGFCDLPEATREQFPEIPFCALCASEYEKYMRAREIAFARYKRIAKRKGIEW